MQELIYFSRHTALKDWPAELDEVTQDIDMSFRYCADHFESDRTPTIASSSVIWLHRRQRELWGGEALGIQGLPWVQLSEEAQQLVTHKRMIDLAGNAFSGFVIAPIITSALALYNWPGDGDVASSSDASEAFGSGES